MDECKPLLLGRNSLGVFLGHWYLVTWPFVSSRDRFYAFLDAATAHRGLVGQCRSTPLNPL